MKKRITALALALVFCLCLLPVPGYAEVSEPVLGPEQYVPQNVAVQFLGREIHANGESVLNLNVSWDDNPAINYCELYPFVADTLGGLYFLPLPNGSTIVRQGADASAPKSVQWTTQNGRNSLSFPVRLLNENEEQFVTMQNGGNTYRYANGYKENDVGVVMMTAVIEPGSWTESDYSYPVEFTNTQENAENHTVFREPPAVGTNKAPTVSGVLYDAETTELAVEFTTEDVDSRYFETLVLTQEEIENSMGIFTIKGVVYYLLGIMSFDEQQPSVSIDKETGYAIISGEQYFGENEVPKIGDELYISVQTEGRHRKGDWGEGSDVSEPVKITVGEVESPKDLIDLSAAEVAVKKPEGGWYTTEEMKELGLNEGGKWYTTDEMQEFGLRVGEQLLSEGEEYTSSVTSEEEDGETTSTKTFMPVWKVSKGKTKVKARSKVRTPVIKVNWNGRTVRTKFTVPLTVNTADTLDGTLQAWGGEEAEGDPLAETALKAIEDGGDCIVTRTESDITVESPGRMDWPEGVDLESLTQITVGVKVKDADGLEKLVGEYITVERDPVFTGEKFRIPNDTREIRDGAFMNDVSITELYVPDGCLSIGKHAFRDCTGLKQIRIPANCVIGEGAFDGCPVEAVFGPAGGTAEKWAKDHGVPFFEE